MALPLTDTTCLKNKFYLKVSRYLRGIDQKFNTGIDEGREGAGCIVDWNLANHKKYDSIRTSNQVQKIFQ